MAKVQVTDKSKETKVPVRVKMQGHRAVVGHSMFINPRHFTKLMLMAGRG